MFKDLLNLFFPVLCVNCNCDLVGNESILCVECLAILPFTDSHNDEDSDVAKKFRGRTHLEFAGAFTFYNRAGIMQKLIHRLKYSGDTRIGYTLGRMYGEVLDEVAALRDIDFIIPVPLHPKKKKERGFNQAKCIAEGISQRLRVPVDDTLIFKKSRTKSQTRKDLYSRWQNTNEVFQINRKCQDLGAKHFLIVDDVITTGATLCSCSELLLQCGKMKVSVAAISFTNK